MTVLQATRSVAATILMIIAVGACAGGPAPTPTDESVETFPDLPTFNSSPGDPFDTLPPESTATSSPFGGLGDICPIEPPVVAVGALYQLIIVEGAGWYGRDRYYQVVGMPGESFQEFELQDGGAGRRVLLTRTAPADQGFDFTVSVLMRDWDIHGIRPGGAGAPTFRPPATLHEASCAGELHIPFIP